MATKHETFMGSLSGVLPSRSAVASIDSLFGGSSEVGQLNGSEVLTGMITSGLRPNEAFRPD